MLLLFGDIVCIQYIRIYMNTCTYVPARKLCIIQTVWYIYSTL